jgi:hypothetical protein
LSVSFLLQKPHDSSKRVSANVTKSPSDSRLTAAYSMSVSTKKEESIEGSTRRNVSNKTFTITTAVLI